MPGLSPASGLILQATVQPEQQPVLQRSTLAHVRQLPSQLPNPRKPRSSLIHVGANRSHDGLTTRTSVRVQLEPKNLTGLSIPITPSAQTFVCFAIRSRRALYGLLVQLASERTRYAHTHTRTRTRTRTHARTRTHTHTRTHMHARTHKHKHTTLRVL